MGVDENKISIEDLRSLEGPNVYALFPVVVAELDLGEHVDSASNEKVAGRLVELFPEIQKHRCSGTREGYFVERLNKGTYPAHIIEHIALAVQNTAGSAVSFGKAVWNTGDRYEVVLEYRVEEAAKKSLGLAVDTMNGILNDDLDIDKIDQLVEEVERIVARKRLGPSTRAILEEARKRDIPYENIHSDFSLFSLGWGVDQKKIWGPETSETGLVAADIAKNKVMAKKILYESGLPVPRGRSVNSEEEAVKAAEELRYPVVLKPSRGHHGKGVMGDLRDEEEVRDAYSVCKTYYDRIMVEEFVRGDDYRFLVVNNEVVAVAKRLPPHVVGDGVSTIRELVKNINQDPRRGEGHRSVLTKIEIDEEEKRYLDKQGYTPESVPERDEKVYLRIGGNLSQGGTSVDHTDEVHNDIKSMVERASKSIGLDIIGIDVISKDITVPLEDTYLDIIEVNASPGLRMHTDPSSGESRDVGKKIVDGLYPDGNGRIPLVAVTGTNGKTTTSRMIEWIARKAGRNTGLAVTGGIYNDGDLVTEGDTTGPWSAGVVLNDQDVDFAVLETARGGIIRRGLEFDKCDVSVLTNIRKDHIGIDGIESVEDIFWVKSVLLEATDEDGACVINANDDFAEEALERANGVPVLFAVEENELVDTHKKEGGTVFTVEEDELVLYKGGKREILVSISQVPFMLGKVKMLLEDALAASAAAFSSGFSSGQIKEGLKTFEMNEEMNPGRMNIYDYNGSRIILDYAHNIDGIRALGEFIKNVPGKRCMATFTVPGDREDDFIVQCGEEGSRWFDVLVCTENPRVMRGRDDGEIAELLAKGVNSNGGNVPITIPSRERAIEFLLENADDYDKLVIADLDIDKEELRGFISGIEGRKNT